MKSGNFEFYLLLFYFLLLFIIIILFYLLFTAIWMLPRYQDYGQWPASGEIDIVESRGNSGLMLNGVNIGAEQVSQTLHWGPHFFLNQYEKTSWSKNSVPGYDSDFHIYGLEWTPGKSNVNYC